MSTWSKVPITRFSSASNKLINGSISKSGAGLGTFSNMGRPLWEPIGTGRFSSKDNSKPMSTVAYAKKLQCEEELRTQTKAFQIPISKIVKELPRPVSWKTVMSDL